MSLSNDKIHQFIVQHEKDAKAIKNEALRLCWWMKGGLTYDQAMALSPTERELIAKIIHESLENSKSK